MPLFAIAKNTINAPKVNLNPEEHEMAIRGIALTGQKRSQPGVITKRT